MLKELEQAVLQDSKLISYVLEPATREVMINEIEGNFVTPKYNEANNINFVEMEDKLDDMEAEKDTKQFDLQEYNELKETFDEHVEKIEEQTIRLYNFLLDNFSVDSFLKHAIDKIQGKSKDDDIESIDKPEFLLTSNSNIEFANDNSISGEIELTKYFLQKEDGNPRNGTDMRNEIRNYLLDQFKGLNNIDNKNQFMSDFRNLLQSLARKGTLTEKGMETQNTKNIVYSDKSKDTKLKELFKAFRSGNTTWSSPQVFFNQENPPVSQLQIRIKVNQEKLEEWKNLLERSYMGKDLEKVRPFLNVIDKRILGTDDIQGKIEKITMKFDADKFVGSLDLKKTERRNSIYRKWDEVRKDFKSTKTSIENFQGKLKKVIDSSQFKQSMEKDEDSRDKFRIAQDIIDFETEPEGNKDALNYIIQVPSISIKRLDSKNMYVQAFQDIGKFAQELKEDLTGLPKFSREGKFSGNAKINEDGDATFTDKKGKDSEGYDIKEENAVDPETGGELDISEMQNDQEKESLVQQKFTQAGDFAGLTQEIQIEGATGRGMTGAIKDIDAFGRKANDLVSINVDPLYAYAFDKDKDVFKNLPIFKSEIKKLNRKIDILNSANKSLDLNVYFDDDILDYIDDLKDRVISDRKTFYLPISPELSSLVGKEYTNYNARLEYIEEFLELVSQIVDFGSPSSRTGGGGWANETSEGDSKSPTLSANELPNKNIKTMINDIGESKDAFDEMIAQIVAYYVSPISQQYKPFDSQIKIMRPQLAEMLTRSKSSEDPYFHLLSLRAGGIEKLFPTGNFKIISNISDMLKYVVTPSKFTNRTVFQEKLKRLKADLILIYGQPFASVIEAELGAYYYGTLTKTVKPLEQKTLKIFGKKAVEFNKEVAGKKQTYPLHALVTMIKINSERLEQLAKELDSGQKGKEVKNKDILEEYLEVMKTFSNTIVKSDTEIKILEAHDDIRKMLDKPVYYKHGNLGEYTHVNNARKILKSNYNVDVSVTDIENIVLDTNSMASLGLKYGIPSEGVYFLKANFR